MSEERIIEARNICGNYFKEGYNCCESVFLGFRDMILPTVDRDMVKIATGFGGGMGEAGCVCGALTGAQMVISLLSGRISTAEDRKIAYALTEEFHHRFKSFFGSTCCRVINKHGFADSEYVRGCLKVTGNTGKLLMEYLVEKKLVS